MVQTLKDHKTFKVWCGWWHTTVAVSNEQDEDSVYSWGCPDHQQLGRNTSDAPHSLPSTVPFPVRIQVRSIACGWKHSLLATIDGQVYAWGKGRHGELGLGDIVKEATTPRIISTISEIQQVLCGWQHSVFHSLNGQVLACGNNRHGQLGIHHGTDIVSYLVL
jgi:alpha-tubulin suppressor-like RCC1 family protein